MGVASTLKKEFSFIQGNTLILVLSWVLMDFAMEMPGTYYPRYVEELGGSPFIVGIIGCISFIILALVQFPGGYLADKYGRRWLISTLTFGVAFSYVFYAVAPSWQFILIGAIVQNLCLIYQPALSAITADSLPSERRGMGFTIIVLITKVATTPGPMVAGLLYAYYDLVYGMRIGYVIVVVLFLTAAILRLRLKETVGKGGRIDLKELVNSYPEAIKECIGVWRHVPRSMLYLLLASFFGTFSGAMTMPCLLFYAVNQLQIQESTWWLYMTFIFIVMIISAIPCGKLIDKIGRKTPLLISYILLLPAILLFVYGDPIRLIIALPLYGIPQILMNSAFLSLQADLVPREQRGKVTGSMNFFNNLLRAAGMATGGFLYQYVSPQLPFLFIFVFLIPEILMTLFLVHEPEKREE